MLMDVINPKGNENSAQAPSENVSDFVVDLITLVQTLIVIPKTFEKLIWKSCQSDAPHCKLWLTHIEKSPSHLWKGRKEELLQKSM